VIGIPHSTPFRGEGFGDPAKAVKSEGQCCLTVDLFFKRLAKKKTARSKKRVIKRKDILIPKEGEPLIGFCGWITIFVFTKETHKMILINKLKKAISFVFSKAIESKKNNNEKNKTEVVIIVRGSLQTILPQIRVIAPKLKRKLIPQSKSEVYPKEYDQE